jgi:hypothetical protein
MEYKMQDKEPKTASKAVDKPQLSTPYIAGGMVVGGLFTAIRGVFYLKDFFLAEKRGWK